MLLHFLAIVLSLLHQGFQNLIVTNYRKNYSLIYFIGTTRDLPAIQL